MKIKKTIGFDLDNTLCDLTSPIKEIFKTYGVNFYSSLDWNFSNYPEDIKKDIYKLFNNKEVMCNLKPFKDSASVINYLESKNYKVVVVTARNKSFEIETIKFVKNLFGKDIDCYVVSPNESKWDILRKINAVYWIDDCPQYLNEYQERGLKCFMISNDDTKYNHYLRKNIEWYEDISFIKGRL
jgi:FMN phosphatase YigB (HAD superfamily)